MVTKEDIFQAIQTMDDAEKAMLAEAMAPERKADRRRKDIEILRAAAEDMCAKGLNFLAEYDPAGEAEAPSIDELKKRMME